MSRVQDFFGVAPKTVLNKPYMQVQHRENNGVTPTGSTVAGYNDRELNSVIVNEVPGASLASNAVTLPAGKYEIEAFALVRAPDGESFFRTNLVDASDTVLVRGLNKRVSLSTGSNQGHEYTFTNGQFTLSATTVVNLSTYVNTNTTNDFGQPVPDSGDEVYIDLRVWQLDATVKTPVLVNDKLYPLPGNTIVTGNMHGLEYEYTSNSSVTVQPGICMDSTNTTILSASSSQVVTIGSTINTIYNLFLCNDGVVRADTDVNGSGLGAYSIRWIGFVRNGSSGSISDFLIKGNRFKYKNKPLIGQASSASGLSFALEDFCPEQRSREIVLYAKAVGNFIIHYSTNAYSSTNEVVIDGSSLSGAFMMTGHEAHLKTSSGVASVYIHEVTIRR